MSSRLLVTSDQYRTFRREGFLILRAALSTSEIEELRRHTDALLAGRLPEQQRSMKKRDPGLDDGMTCQDLEAPPPGLSPSQAAQYFVRIHMLHKKLEIHERFLLHSRILDVVQALIGPDVLALSTMLFLKPPGKLGQGWHQDSFYIPTYPDTLCGVWIAIDDCDPTNGALRIAEGSCCEPVHPPLDGYGFGDALLDGVVRVSGASASNDECNSLAAVAAQYPIRTLEMKAGDAVLFGGHVLHSSLKNRSATRLRRSFAAHYCNARSFVRWGRDQRAEDVHAAEAIDASTGMTNGSFVLARGTTHLPYAHPRFGTLVDTAQQPPLVR